MEFLNFLREELVMALLVFLGFLLVVVSVTSLFRRKMSGSKPVDELEQPARATKPVRFGNQTELVLVFFGILLLLAVIGWIRKLF
jgi:uncharacterized membrane protein